MTWLFGIWGWSFRGFGSIVCYSVYILRVSERRAGVIVIIVFSCEWYVVYLCLYFEYIFREVLRRLCTRG